MSECVTLHWSHWWVNHHYFRQITKASFPLKLTSAVLHKLAALFSLIEKTRLHWSWLCVIINILFRKEDHEVVKISKYCCFISIDDICYLAIKCRLYECLIILVFVPKCVHIYERKTILNYWSIDRGMCESFPSLRITHVISIEWYQFVETSG